MITHIWTRPDPSDQEARNHSFIEGLEPLVANMIMEFGLLEGWEAGQPNEPFLRVARQFFIWEKINRKGKLRVIEGRKTTIPIIQESRVAKLLTNRQTDFFYF